MTLLFSNNASSTLAQAINNSDDPVVLVLAAGGGTLFPDPVGNDTFLVTLQDASGAIEILLATDRTGDTITAERAQEGTTARAFAVGARCECRLTAGILDAFVQDGSPIDMGGSALSNASVNSSAWNGGTMQAGVYRSTVGSDNNAITIPDNDALPPHVDGDPLVTESRLAGTETRVIYDMVYPVGIVVFMSNFTNPQSVAPPGVQWRQLTEGYDKFLKMSGIPNTDEPVGSTQTGLGGEHSHGGGVTGSHQLTEDELPIHSHGLGFGDSLLVAGATGAGWPLSSPATVGVEPPPLATGTVGRGSAHSHPIEQSAGHVHPIDPQPPHYTLVPWLRIS